MYKILMVEDERNARKILRSYIESIDRPVEVIEAANGREAKKLIQEHDFTMFFLDIKLPDISGLDVAKYIRSIPRYRLTQIVMLTSMIYFQQEAFKRFHVYDFIEKPYIKKDILRVLYEIFDGLEERESNDSNGSIKIQNKQGIYKIRVDKLLFVESVGRKKVFHTYDYDYEIPRMTMEQVIETLPDGRFIQVHKSFLVNIHKVDRVEQCQKGSWAVKLETGSEVPVSDKFKDELLSSFVDEGE